VNGCAVTLQRSKRSNMKVEIPMPKSIAGLKTYTVSAILVLVGVAFLLWPLSNTWGNPQGETETAVRSVIGWIAVLLGLSTASLRHAIQRLPKGPAQVRQLRKPRRKKAGRGRRTAE